MEERAVTESNGIGLFDTSMKRNIVLSVHCVLYVYVFCIHEYQQFISLKHIKSRSPLSYQRNQKVH